MKALYRQEIKTGEFTIDLSRLNYQCKGVLQIEVRPARRMDTLILDDNISDLISHDYPFKIVSNVPIVNGIMHFKPYTKDVNGWKSKEEMQSVVRYILEE